MNRARKSTFAAAVVFGAALFLAGAAPLLAQGLTEMRADFDAEARLLESRIEEYDKARGREEDALTELSRLSRLVDETLADSNSGRSDLVNLETQLAVARERACAYAEESADERRGMYESMERLASMVRKLERQGITDLDGVAGSWQVEAQPIDVWGFLDLRQEGTLVSGSYRLSNGNEGSVRGTFAGGRLAFELVDSARGVVGDVEGELAAESGEIHGTWHAREVSSGRPAAGDWTARRVE